MLSKLNEMLSPMQGKNVDIMIEHNGDTLMSISTEKFEYAIDDLYFTISNNCKDCQFESKFIVDDIMEIDDNEYADEDTLVITFEEGIQLYLTKI